MRSILARRSCPFFSKRLPNDDCLVYTNVFISGTRRVLAITVLCGFGSHLTWCSTTYTHTYTHTYRHSHAVDVGAPVPTQDPHHIPTSPPLLNTHIYTYAHTHIYTTDTTESTFTVCRGPFRLACSSPPLPLPALPGSPPYSPPPACVFVND
jgi:hypothetical protein